MSKNRKIKRKIPPARSTASSRSKAKGAPVSRKPPRAANRRAGARSSRSKVERSKTVRRPVDAGRSREIVGIIGLGSGIFIVAALLSLQIGDGRLMGPFGRSIAATVYAFGGMCSYLLALGLVLVALRLLTDREPALPRSELLGIGIGLASLATLAHLIGAGYRVDDHAPGGLVGEGLAEVLRAVISTAGTALVAVMGLIVAAVVATPLRMNQLLGLLTHAGRWVLSGVSEVGDTFASIGVAVGHFCGDVVRAILPERDHDEYLENEANFLGDNEEYDAYELDDEEEQAVPTPPIIETNSSAVPVAAIDADTERIDEAELERRIAEARAEAVADVRAELEVDVRAEIEAEVADEAAAASENAVIEAAVTEEVVVLDKVKSTKSAKPKKIATSKKPAASETKNVDVAEPQEATQTNSSAVELPSATSTTADASPLIVESKFQHRDAAELAALEERADADRLDFIPLGEGEYQLPPVNLLDYDESRVCNVDKSAMLELSARLTKTLEHYKIKGEVVAIRPGPVVTMYEFAPALGTRLSKIVGLSDDLAMALEALRVRIVAPIPGKAAVGIEVPNKIREMVYLKEILADDKFQKNGLKLPMAMGKDIEGAPIVVDLSKMPHLLVAGTTGSGKSVSVNSMIASLLYDATPEDVRMIMIDPKMLELSIYEGIPHLLLPVVTDPKKANLALLWAVEEMERRYQLLSEMRVRDIASYNKKQDKLNARYEADRLRTIAEEAERLASGDDEVEITEERQMHLPSLEEPPTKLPYIVIIIDEFADLMMCAPKDVETSVARIAQKARAAGIHLVLATQRPSVNVITGLIKANFPSRAAFHVTSKIDSRTILDQGGAERLLGAGDMLFSDRGAAPRRIHGCFIGEEEIGRVVEFLKEQGRPVYNMEILKPRVEESADGDDLDEDVDVMYDKAVAIVAESRQVSISMIQRRLRIGYNRAARIVECMERNSVVSTPDHQNKREVLLSDAA